MKTVNWALALLLTSGLAACGDRPDDDLGLEVDAQDIDRAAEEAADAVTEENADELLEQLEQEIAEEG